MDKDRVSRMKRGVGWMAVFFLLILLDQVLKGLAKNIFLNENFAFSLPLPAWLMYAVYAGVLYASGVYLVRQRGQLSLWQQAGWFLIWAGAFSNIGERIVLGHVRDFIYITLFGLTGIYNLADGYILLGIAVLFFKDKKVEKLG